MTHAEARQSSATERYLLDEMTPEERDAFEAHYFDCAECAEDLRIAARMRDGARAGLLAAAAMGDAKRRRRSWIQTAALPWAVAATLALAAGYQTVRLRQAAGPLAPQALAPITLRPSSRGAEAMVTLSAAARAATFALDLPDARSSNLAFTLQTVAPDGARDHVASGEIAAPPAGAPVLILVPSSTLTPGQHYVLAIEQAGGALLEEYRFAVAKP